jgi:hypothetical protein
MELVCDIDTLQQTSSGRSSAVDLATLFDGHITGIA